MQHLIVACYAIQADKAWFRREVPQEAPALARITDDLTLRAQELPGEGEFAAAAKRAEGIFRIKPQPVLSARSVQALARAAQDYAREHQADAEALAAELDKNARTLGLHSGAPRVQTAWAASGLLGRVVVARNPTAVIRELATGLPRDNAIYYAHLQSARALAGKLRDLRWQVLDEIAVRADEQDQAQANAVIAPLRKAARHDEHEQPLAEPLRIADKAALDLVLEWNRTGPSALPVDVQFVSEAGSMPGHSALTVQPDMGGAGRHQEPARVAAKDVPALLEEIRQQAASHPDADFEITWRVIDR